jgi:hypothetical protein
MTTVNQTIGFIFKIILAFFILAGVGQSLLSARQGLDVLNTFFYFTIQSNLILLGVMAAGIVRSLSGRAEGRMAAFVRNGSTIWILITGLVYHFMLYGVAVASGRFNFSHVALHYISPLMAILNWILFEEKGRARLVYAVTWLVYPLAYVGLSLIRLAIDGFYPYWFLNPLLAYPAGTGSVGMMLAIVGGLVVIFGLVGLLIAVLDRALGRRIKQPPAGPA